MRVIQRAGERGSLRWIQRAINQSASRDLDDLILPMLGGAASISWLSPLANDDFAEYRDAAFLNVIGVMRLAGSLAEFWPAGGPQWDALGRSDQGDVLLVEAKAHVGELCSPGSQASPVSRRRIQTALDRVGSDLRARPRAPWIDVFYQLANRIAHLHFLRKNGEKAWLVLVNFIGDFEMMGPRTVAEWEAAYQVVWHVMGLEKRHPLSRYVVHVYPTAT
jgi:hypothetical protein